MVVNIVGIVIYGFGCGGEELSGGGLQVVAWVKGEGLCVGGVELRSMGGEGGCTGCWCCTGFMGAECWVLWLFIGGMSLVGEEGGFVDGGVGVIGEGGVARCGGCHGKCGAWTIGLGVVGWRFGYGGETVGVYGGGGGGGVVLWEGEGFLRMCAVRLVVGWLWEERVVWLVCSRGGGGFVGCGFGEVVVCEEGLWCAWFGREVGEVGEGGKRQYNGGGRVGVGDVGEWAWEGYVEGAWWRVGWGCCGCIVGFELGDGVVSVVEEMKGDHWQCSVWGQVFAGGWEGLGVVIDGGLWERFGLGSWVGRNVGLSEEENINFQIPSIKQSQSCSLVQSSRILKRDRATLSVNENGTKTLMCNCCQNVIHLGGEE
ncbi:hypothetical protein Tco_0445776 [Tanacetum coccineum]